MGQTLSHGVYLPNEGERNCYAGLASNWQILNTAVGAIAEKAPLVHTHTVSQITDFPAYGNAAGTICEGNDSRLSDARTPVAHTHGKADITDLFNSANTWSALNSYNQSIQITANFDIGAAPSSDISGGFSFGNGTTNIGNVTARINRAGITYSRLYVSNKYANGALDPNGTLTNVELQVGLKANGNRFIYSNASWDNSLIPYANNTYDLGSSSYQWNNLYAKNYYYNGTQWGLDQANTWTGRQTYRAYIKSFGEARTDDWSSNSRTNAYLLSRRDTDDVSGFLISTFRSNVAQGTAMHIYGWDILENSTRYSGLRFTIDWDSTLNSGSGAYRVTLGTNTQGTNPCNDLHITQLKTINGINPGALSLPDLSVSQNVDTTGWTFNGTTLNSVLLNSGDTNVTKNGWLYIRTNSTVSGDRIGVRLSNTAAEYPTTIAGEIGFGHIEVFVPIVAGYKAYVFTNKAPTYIKFYPCLGNVPSGV